ncbi:conserved hypothetical protein [Deferribacter desulfuricans SSM1]|uniref:DUF4139 domain-containing protein n=1 Tax=Deferribacter desulfuricans (strain DSM 14783 / JCM 11476 / NBRC 101012 / SSM1) TaxID=639282 RepID=D3PBS3_DEFDS|nr:DUF4139 domain-containing protein [Deferribacter desulfuricans]BAI80046.1 conserved hypothetical protein [Deferribacter desulfuricans SSM1]
MNRLFVVCLMLILFATNLFAAKVDIYRDFVFYETTLKNGFIGFNKDVDVRCNGKSVNLVTENTLKLKCFLCDLYNKKNELTKESEKLSSELKLIDSTIKNVKLNSNEFLQFNIKVADEISNIKSKQQDLLYEINKINNLFSKSAPDNVPYFVQDENCSLVKMKFSGVSFNIVNQLNVENIAGDKAKLRIIKKAKIVNKSGVDIVADEAKLMFKSSSSFQGELSFNPWVVNIFEPFKRFLKSKSVQKSDVFESKEEIVDKGNREYLIKNFVLPANGKEKDFILNSAVKIGDYELITYPYLNKNVFREISFELPFDLESNSWTVSIGDEQFSNITGKQVKNRYKLLAGKLYDVKVERKRILDFEESAGFFGNKKRINDGYIITLTNISNINSYSLKVVDRVPVSKNEKIEVKDVKVSEDKCSINSEGKVECNIVLPPNKSIDIKVTFTILYDKDVEITY